MNNSYEEMIKLANSLGYKRFTRLQELAFSNDEVYEEERNLFVIGATSSGKTLIPLLLYYRQLVKAEKENRECPRMLFIVPYRALASQKQRELSLFFSGKKLTVVQSTGEFQQDDEAIRNGEVDVAIIIIEKAFKNYAKDASFFSRYDYIVLDEVGLIGDSGRGVKLDFLLSWAEAAKMNASGHRMIALGTTSMNWDEYIQAYDFCKIISDDRPVKLVRVAVVFAKNKGIISADPNSCIRKTGLYKKSRINNCIKQFGFAGSVCDFHKPEGTLCPITDPCRSDSRILCEHTNRPCCNPALVLPQEITSERLYILVQICKYHLKRQQQILIFVNDIEDVRRLSKQLYNCLRDDLDTVPEGEECRDRILTACGLESDDVVGVLEDNYPSEDDRYIYYQALCAGIGFHSRAVPSEVRSFIEEEFLEKRRLKIVCSTETLAFGVNSSVDVVVIGDLYKHDGISVRPLSLNEYNNYIGRAGRNSKRRDPGSQTCGYVYTLVRENQEKAWSELNGSTEKPLMYSRFFSDSEDNMPFFLLNLFPNMSQKTTWSRLRESIRMLPRSNAEDTDKFQSRLKDSLDFLIVNRLVINCKRSTVRRRLVDSENEYELTHLGNLMRGYILCRSDYELIIRAFEEQPLSPSYKLDRITFLYRLLQSRHAENNLRVLFTNTGKDYDVRGIITLLKSHFPEDSCPSWLEEMDAENPVDKKEIRILYILCTLISWMDSESPGTIFRKYGIHYSLLSKLSEQIGYLLEIAASIYPWFITELWNRNLSLYEKFGFDTSEEAFERMLTEHNQYIREFYSAIYYGINTTVWNALLSYLRGVKEPAADKLANLYSSQCLNPLLANKLRRIAVRYVFFDGPSRANDPDIEIRNNYKNQRDQYRKDIKEIGGYIQKFFTEKFGTDFTGGQL